MVQWCGKNVPDDVYAGAITAAREQGIDPAYLLSLSFLEAGFRVGAQCINCARDKDGNIIVEHSIGPYQINLNVHPLTEDQARDPLTSARWAASKLAKGGGSLWENMGIWSVRAQAWAMALACPIDTAHNPTEPSGNPPPSPPPQSPQPIGQPISAPAANVNCGPAQFQLGPIPTPFGNVGPACLDFTPLAILGLKIALTILAGAVLLVAVGKLGEQATGVSAVDLAKIATKVV